MIKDLFALNLDGFDGVHLCPLNWLIDLVLCSITLVSNLAFVEVCQHSSTPGIAIVLALVLFFAEQILPVHIYMIAFPTYPSPEILIFVLSCMINVDHGLYHDPYPKLPILPLALSTFSAVSQCTMQL